MRFSERALEMALRSPKDKAQALKQMLGAAGSPGRAGGGSAQAGAGGAQEEGGGGHSPQVYLDQIPIEG